MKNKKKFLKLFLGYQLSYFLLAFIIYGFLVFYDFNSPIKKAFTFFAYFQVIFIVALLVDYKRGRRR